MGAARSLCFAIVVSLAQACAETTAVLHPAPPPDPRTQMVALESRIFALVQDQRHKIDPNAKMLALDSELVGVARAHSEDMATKNYFAHKSPTGTTSADLIMDADADFQGLLGENLAAQHFIVGASIDVDALAHRFVDSWLASPSHKDNLAFGAYDRSGVGAAVGGNTIYVTELFATDLGLSQIKAPPKSRQVTEFPNAKAAKDSPAKPPPASNVSPATPASPPE
jgi:uncharacterized protein YkwD